MALQSAYHAADSHAKTQLARVNTETCKEGLRKGKLVDNVTEVGMPSDACSAYVSRTRHRGHSFQYTDPKKWYKRAGQHCTLAGLKRILSCLQPVRAGRTTLFRAW